MLSKEDIVGPISNFRVSNFTPNVLILPNLFNAMHLLFFLASLSALLSPAYSLYFYLEGSQIRCFLEDLPKDTLVVGPSLAPPFPSSIVDNRPFSSRGMEFRYQSICPKFQHGSQNHCRRTQSSSPGVDIGNIR
jgi:hypothetical protein